MIQNMAAATGFSAFIRLEGAGLQNGPESVCAGAGGNAVATGGNFVNKAVRIPINLEVIPGNEIQIFGEMAGTDVGGLGFVVGLEFSDAAGEGSAKHKTMTVEGDVATVDARAALSTQGSVVSPSMIAPAGFTKIEKLIVAATSEGLADGKQVFYVRLGGNSVQGGEQIIPVSASGRIAVQAGSDAAPQCMTPLVLDNLDIAISPSDTVSVWAEGAGDDTGTGHACITMVFA
jgi:hypothetical protein